jgi:hypothetical protein
MALKQLFKLLQIFGSIEKLLKFPDQLTYAGEIYVWIKGKELVDIGQILGPHRHCF